MVIKTMKELREILNYERKKWGHPIINNDIGFVSAKRIRSNMLYFRCMSNIYGDRCWLFMVA